VDGEDLLTLPANAGDVGDLGAGLADAADALAGIADLADAADAMAGIGDLAEAADAMAGLGTLVADLPNLADGVAALVPAEALAVPVEALPLAAAGWVARLIVLFGRYAYLLALAGSLIENTLVLGFLLPGGTVVALAGAGARAVGLPLPVLVFLAAAGMTGGACIDYWMGRAGVARLLLHPRLQAHPRTGTFCRGLAVKLDGAAPLLRRHGWWMMLMAHAFGHGRSTMALAAGAGRLPLRRFLAIEVPAAVLWATIFAGGGYLLADRWQAVELALRQVGAVGLLLLPAAGALWWWRRSRRARRTARARPA
jgi:membrane protein DedA with SNARE-associated domain